MYGLRVLHLLGVEVPAGIIREQPRENEEAVERGAQLVRHLREEFRLHAVRLLRGGSRVHEFHLQALALAQVAHDLGETQNLPRAVAYHRHDHIRPEP